MKDKSGKMSAEDKLLEEFKKERKEISEQYHHGKIDFNEYHSRVQQCIGKSLDKLNSLPKVSEMKI